MIIKKIILSSIILSLFSLGIIYLFKSHTTFWETRFKEVLNQIKENSINNHLWDTQSWEKYFNNQYKNLPIISEKQFLSAVDIALKDLGDNHSFLIKSNDTYAITGASESDYSISVDDGIGIILMPVHFCKNMGDLNSILDEEWVTKFHSDLSTRSRLVTKGWIIDLTANSGGNMYPMLAALSYFYRTKELGGFLSYFNPDKSIRYMVSFDGNTFSIGDQNHLSYRHKFVMNQNNLPVVVLIGNKTASSAEFLALALKRQKNIILMGEETAGLATGNEVMLLPDNLGSYMLTVCYYLNEFNEPLFSKKVLPNLIVKSNLYVAAKNYFK